MTSRARIRDFIKSFQSYYYMVLAFILCFTPFYHTYITKKISLDNPVDPEYINGLLTVSSILFGFSSILVFGQRKENKWLKYLLLFPLVILGFSGGSIWNVVIGINKPMQALLWAWTSVLANIFVTWFLAGFSRTVERTDDSATNALNQE